VTENDTTAPATRTRVTRVGPRVAPPAPAPAPDSPPQTPGTPAATDSLGRRLQQGFAVAIVAGTVLALVGIVPGMQWVGFAGPLLAIAGFFTWGYRAGFSKRGDTRQRFADSCYFLGFLLTMTAMLAGFFPSGMFEWELTSQGILRHFSMALGATALGLIFRIVALQGGRSIEEDLGEAEAELRVYVAKVSAEAREIGNELETVRMHIAAHHQKLDEQLANSVPAALEGALQSVHRSSRDISTELAEQAKSLRDTAALVAQSLAARHSELDRIERETAEGQEQLAGSLTSMTEALNDLAASFRTMQQETARAVSEAAREIGKVAAGFGRTEELTHGIAAQVDGLGGTLRTIDREIGQFSGEIGAARAATVRLADDGEALQAQLRSDHEAARAALRTSVEEAAARQSEAASESLARIGQEAQQSAERAAREGQALAQRATEFEASLSSAVAQFSGIVDRFSGEIARLRDGTRP